MTGFHHNPTFDTGSVDTKSTKATYARFRVAEDRMRGAIPLIDQFC